MLHRVVDEKSERRKFRERLKETCLKGKFRGNVQALKQGTDKRQTICVSLRLVKGIEVDGGEHLRIVSCAGRRMGPPGIVALYSYKR
ncbi:MAG: hypothetical protein WAN14_20010, partial [Candidatus Acidiferrales bacterium]